MGTDRASIADAVKSIMRDLSTPDTVLRAEETGWNHELWSVLAEGGFTLVSVPESAGGSGGEIADAAVVLKEAGGFAAAGPIAETALLAGWALATAGLQVSDGPTTTGVGHARDRVRLDRVDGAWQADGSLSRVPWASRSERIVLIGQHEGRDHVLWVPRSAVTVTPGQNLAGESRDGVVLAGVRVPEEQVAEAPSGVHSDALRLRGALARALQMSGALTRVCELTVRYASAREQFGRPIARFQAVQRHLVRIAEQTQAANMAADVAALNAADHRDFFDVAAAKIVAGEAAGIAAAAAHQAHGAIGMTKEYELGQLTRRLWAWRDECGSEAYWSRLLGDHVVAQGADQIWPRISTSLVPSPKVSAQSRPRR